VYRADNEPKAYEGRVKDLSCSGAKVVTDQNFPVNQKMDLNLHIPGYDTVSAPGRVVWAHTVDGQNVIGVRFFNISCAAQDVILRYALHTNKEALIKYWFEGWEGKREEDTGSASET